MSFVDQSRRPSPASMAAVIGVHAAIGAALVAGLTVSGAMPEIVNKIGATNIPVPPPPPPADPVELSTSESMPTIVQAPPTQIDINPIDTPFDTTPIPVPNLPTVPSGTTFELPTPTPQPSFDPVSAKPRNDPARWLTDNDYRPSWARRELTGTARFRLEIAATGKVTSCTVTGSTGHSELDTATCALVTKRARFEPARGSNGEPVAGSFSSAVKWELPN
ncbi:hypothetical protein BA950_02815 [Erythrobacter sp. SAORIC-644]|uniref:energy transducer TonB n=1 Tax=Erythrobacter sp. SAORIC-644 TaxID=1869314 RepID=UPI000C9FA516|nr:energy transducer TonB [Erythrobacter sp. SAORIC-644]PNQ77949.1 hypothetical protein BA950_02815 [Erythrobacter sp. SAORIC-644]